jgi:hypothetical protein
MDPTLFYIFGISFGISISIISCSICYLQTETETETDQDNCNDIENNTKEEYQLLKKSVDSGTGTYTYE